MTMNNVRPPRPPKIEDDKFWKLIELCWAHDYTKRPRFRVIKFTIARWLSKEPDLNPGDGGIRLSLDDARVSIDIETNTTEDSDRPSSEAGSEDPLLENEQ